MELAIMWVGGMGAGIGVGILVNHLLVSRPLTRDIAQLRKEGYRLAEPSEPVKRVESYPQVLEDV